MPPRRTQGFRIGLSSTARLRARWETERDVVRYAVLLLTLVGSEWRPVALFDCSHDGRNDHHRYDRDGVKGPAVRFHHGAPGEAMRAAIELIRTDHERMIERWHR
jgi:hypothetical protein